MKINTSLSEGKLDSLLVRFLERNKNALEKIKKQDAIARRKGTLFDIEPNFEWIRLGHCGICNKPLKVTQNGRVAYCGRKKCLARPPFVITIEKLYKLKMK